MENKNNNNNNIKKSRAEWEKEWELEKQTEGLDKESLAKQKKIIESLKSEEPEQPKKSDSKNYKN